MSIDQLYVDIREYVKFGDMDNARQLLAQLKERIDGELTNSSRSYNIRNIERILDGNKNAFILDYGCGGGRTVIYLHLLGFKNVYGIDLVLKENNTSAMDLNNKIMELLGIKVTRFFHYDGSEIPFANNTYDVVYSEQVLEHVHDIDRYYKETSRVLKSGSFAYFSFPHKFIPYDSHGRTWLIHMLPKSMAYFFYRILGRDVDRLKKLLNFQTISHHKKIASKYFCEIKNIASERLKHFSEEDLLRYKGNKKMRKVVDISIKRNILSSRVIGILSSLAIADLIMKKS